MIPPWATTFILRSSIHCSTRHLPPTFFLRSSIHCPARHLPRLVGRSFSRHSSRAFSSSPSKDDIPSASVSVFDNVLSPACCSELTSTALYNIGPEVYRRSNDSESPQDVLIESLLQGLGFDGTREVEWWGRSEYKSVEAHRDVDEEAAAVRGERRYPTHSLVVYLDVLEGMRAPTCVWVPSDEKSALLAVPAVPGRMLVFSGELLHAVPCPTLSWLDGHREGDDKGSMGGLRRVLVLNLWDDHAPADEEWQEWDEDEEDWDGESGWDEEWDEQDDKDDDKDDKDEEQEPIEFFAKRVECEPRDKWRPVALPLPPVDEAHLPNALTLSTRSHGSDDLLLSPLRVASRAALARVLEGESAPRWLWTGADVRDLGIGVPSLAGSREERYE